MAGSMMAWFAGFLVTHRLVAINGRWSCACGGKTFEGKSRRMIVDQHEAHVAGALVAEGVTPPTADPRERLLQRARDRGIR